MRDERERDSRRSVCVFACVCVCACMCDAFGTERKADADAFVMGWYMEGLASMCVCVRGFLFWLAKG